MDNSISNIQLQQQYHQPQLWHAHMAAQYKAVPASVGVSQNERLLDSSAAMCQSASTSSTLSPSPIAQMQGGSYCPTILHHRHQLLPNASSPSSSKGKTSQNQQLGSLHWVDFDHKAPIIDQRLNGMRYTLSCSLEASYLRFTLANSRKAESTDWLFNGETLLPTLENLCYQQDKSCWCLEMLLVKLMENWKDMENAY